MVASFLLDRFYRNTPEKMLRKAISSNMSLRTKQLHKSSKLSHFRINTKRAASNSSRNIQ